MKRLSQFRAAYRRTTTWFGALMLACLALGAGLAFAQTATPRNFDHLKTGFALTGAHVQTRCESCHLNGIFKGTPRDCASCHVSGMRFARGNVVMPGNHLPTTQTCDTCHNTKTYVGARFNHAGVVAGSCASCHNGTTSSGKPANHVQTAAACDTCHRTTAWSPAAKFDHVGVAAGTCTSCHGAGKATGKSPTHIPTGTSTSCDDCHKSFTAWRPTAWNHTQTAVSGQCASCHSGAFPPADGRPTNHVPYTQVAAAASANCDSCHKGSFTTWTNGRFHSNFSVASGCAGCHTGAFMAAVGKPNTAIHANATTCETCHTSTASWSGARVDHSTFNASTNCASCHNGSAAAGRNATHIPIGSASCLSCHNVSPATWKPTKWTHAQVTVAAQCDSCHTGGFPPADGKPTNHVPYASVAAAAAAKCDTCHKGSFITWANGRFHGNVSVSTGCVTCHTLNAGGNFLSAVGKPATATHATVTGNCESCHKSTASWAAASIDHSTFGAATNCAQCHGVSASGKSATHIPTTLNCFTCHNVLPARWTPTKWNHTQVVVANACASCHTGGYPPADGRPTNHIPYQTVAVSSAANCDGCHRGSTTTWANGRFHSSYTVSTGCVTCHTLSASGTYLSAVGKPTTATHATVTGNCESCHKSTANWATASIDHSTFGAATNCAQCHGVSASGKPATHIPTTANCFTCHNVLPARWTPTKWNHTQVVVTNACASCHTGGFPPADGRPTNHIPYQTVAVSSAANCDGCHRGSTATWTNGRFHSYYTVSTGCATCHTLSPGGTYLNAVGKPTTATHATVTGNCESCHKSTANWSSATVDHGTFNAATNCAQCHGVSASGKPANHIPTTANCFTCHNVLPARWTPTKWNHTQVVVTNACASCHTGGYPPADGRPTNHIPYQTVAVSSAANCDGCHRGSTATWTNGRFHSYYTVTTGCVTCHTLTPGGTFLNAVGKPNTATHTGVTGSCESCHRSTANWSAATFAHSPANAVGTGTCDTCHNGTTARGKPATHIPITAATAKCDSCHRSQASFATSVTMNHTVVATQQCKLCHNGSYTSQGTQGALAKPANHIPEVQLLNGAAMDCNACHTGTASWGSMTMNHNNSQGNGAGWCKACHQSGTNFMGSMEKKSLTHERSTGVTDCSQSGCHRPLGNKGTAYRNWD